MAFFFRAWQTDAFSLPFPVPPPPYNWFSPGSRFVHDVNLHLLLQVTALVMGSEWESEEDTGHEGRLGGGVSEGGIRGQVYRGTWFWGAKRAPSASPEYIPLPLSCLAYLTLCSASLLCQCLPHHTLCHLKYIVGIMVVLMFLIKCWSA